MNASTPTWRRDVMAAVLSCAPDAAASHRTAALLWDCPGIPRMTEITSLRGLRRRGVKVHQTTRLNPHEVRRREAIPVTDPERTLIDLGAVTSVDLVESALDHLLSNRFTTLQRIETRLQDLDGPGWRGTKDLRRLVAARGTHKAAAESLLETKLYQLLRSSSLPLPQRQVPILDGSRFVGRVDMAYPDRRLILEAQSFKHHSSRRAWTADVGRRRDLHLLGWRVIEVTWHDVTTGRSEFVEKLRRFLGELSLLG